MRSAALRREYLTTLGRAAPFSRWIDKSLAVLDVAEAALVFTQFAEMGELIRRRLEQRFGHEVPFLHGGVAKAARDTMVESFSAGTGGEVVHSLAQSRW